MRYFKIPEPITVTGRVRDAQGTVRDEKGPFPFARFIQTLADDPKLGANLPGVRTSVRLMEAFEGKNPGDVTKLSDVDYDRAKAIAEEPGAGYNTFIMRQIMPFVELFLNAPEELADLEPKKPEVKANGAADTADAS